MNMENCDLCHSQIVRGFIFRLAEATVCEDCSLVLKHAKGEWIDATDTYNEWRDQMKLSGG